MYTVCPLPQTVSFLCESITKNNIACNTTITCPINHRCYSCQEQTCICCICCMVPIFISLDRKAPLQFDVLLELLMRQLDYELVFIFG